MRTCLFWAISARLLTGDQGATAMISQSRPVLRLGIACMTRRDERGLGRSLQAPTWTANVAYTDSPTRAVTSGAAPGERSQLSRTVCTSRATRCLGLAALVITASAGPS